MPDHLVLDHAFVCLNEAGAKLEGYVHGDGVNGLDGAQQGAQAFLDAVNELARRYA